MTPIDTEKPNLEVTEDRVPAPLNASDADQQADEYERRTKEQQKKQFQILKDEARALFGMLDGRPGIRSPADLQKLLEKAGDEVGNGRFIVRCLGAERYLDAATVAVLISLRQNLIAERGRATAADLMMIDAAIVAYYNFLRVQGWIGNLSLVFERELFGQQPLNQIQGQNLGEKLRDELERLSEVILPLQDRCHRLLMEHRPTCIARWAVRVATRPPPERSQLSRDDAHHGAVS